MKIKKILRYNVYGDGSDIYEYVTTLLDQTIDPPGLEPNALDCEGLPVYTSPLARAQTCINQDTAKSLTTKTALREIPFPLQKYCTKEDFLTYRGSAVRRAFIEAFIDNGLGLSHAELERELDHILSWKQEPFPLLCISHTFRMACLKIYNEIGDELFRNPAIIKQYISPDKHLFDFGETIEI